MKNISTLVEDIYATISNPQTFSREAVVGFCEALTKRIANRFSEERGAGTLRASNLGKPCGRQLWFDVHNSSERETLPAPARLKFLFGDILEELLLFLARQAGHTVEREQAEININGVKGHIDAIVDGHLLDCKSASTPSFEKFRSHDIVGNDPFGYIDQLGAYLAGVKDTPELKDKDVASFLVIDKTLGNVVLDTYPKTDTDYDALVAEKRKMLEQKEPPPRPYQDKAHLSDCRKLPITCAYCNFKFHCWKDSNNGEGLKVAYYSQPKGPVFLTKVGKSLRVKVQ